MEYENGIKHEEQLQQQDQNNESIVPLSGEAKWINVHNMLTFKTTNEQLKLPTAYLTDPENFLAQKAAFEAENAYIQDMIVEDPAIQRQIDDYKAYNEYTNAKERYKAYIEAMNEVIRERHEDFQGAAEGSDYEPALGFRILQQLEAPSVYDTGEERNTHRTDDSILLETAATETAFNERIEQMITENPLLVLKKIELLQYLIPAEVIKHCAMTHPESKYLLINDKYLNKFFDEAEHHAVIMAAIQDPNVNSENILDYFQNEENRDVIGVETVRIAVKRALIGSTDIYMDGLKNYAELGIVSSADIEEIVTEKITGFKPLNYVDVALPYLDSDEKREAVMQRIVDWYQDNALLHDLENIKYPIENKFTPQQVDSLITTVAMRDMFSHSASPMNLKWVAEQIGDEKAHDLVIDVLAMPDFMPTDQTISYFIQAPFLPIEDKMTFVDKLIEIDKLHPMLYQLGILLKDFPQDHCDTFIKGLVEKIGINDVVKLAGTYWAKKISPELLGEYVLNSESNIKQLGNWFESADGWISAFPNAQRNELNTVMINHLDSHAMSLLFGLPHSLQLVDEQEQQLIITQLIKANPLAAMVQYEMSNDTFSQFGNNATARDILLQAKADTETLQLAPKLFGRLYEQISADKTTDEQKSSIIDGLVLYNMIGLVKHTGLLEQYKTIHDQQDLSEKEERDLIGSFYCLALYKYENPDTTIHESINTPQEARITLINSLHEIIELNSETTDEHAQNFLQQMETPVPFYMYAMQYKDSPMHLPLLQEISLALEEGRFREWKFGADTQEALDELQQQQLIPQQLTLEQYQAWRKDENTSLFESLESDSHDAAIAIQSYLRSNHDHLEIDGAITALETKYADMSDHMTMIQAELSAIGEELGRLGRELGPLRKMTEKDEVRISALESGKAELEQRRAEMLKARNSMRLMNIRPEEVASGYLLGGKDGKNKEKTITKVLAELRQAADPGNAFVYDTVDTMLQSFHAETGEKQNLVCTDSSDPKIWIEIGEKPVASCQSYNFGQYNECLVGYTDPNTKILTLKNERGNLIARSIFRILNDDHGVPSLHLETIYSATTSPGALKSIYTRAYQKAHLMGLKLYVTNQSQMEDGNMVQRQVAPGYQLQAVDNELHSYKSRAQSVYVDAKGGPENNGDYTIENISEVQLAVAA